MRSTSPAKFANRANHQKVKLGSAVSAMHHSAAQGEENLAAMLNVSGKTV
jgi:hypothetical protein